MVVLLCKYFFVFLLLRFFFIGLMRAGVRCHTKGWCHFSYAKNNILVNPPNIND